VQYAAWAPLTAFAATLVTVWWLIRSRLSTFVLDHPNRRSLHRMPVPRTGGIGVHLGIVLAWMVVAPSLPLPAWIAFVLLLLISFIDDVRGVPAVLRLAAHLLAAGIVAASLLPVEFGAPVVLMAVIAIAWMTNLYNFMDGCDGLAGGMTLFGFSFYGIAAWLGGSTAFALLNLSIAAAAAAFLLFNFHPARVFLGDIGSVPLGYLAAAFGMIGWLQGDWTLWFPVLVFSPFIVDASITLARRLWRRERVWEAHRDHYYQRLVQLGWGHRKTVLIEYTVMIAVGLTGLLGLWLPATGQILLCVVWGAIYFTLMNYADRLWQGFIGTKDS
jgi:UDP-N-acetylmuramyl pentapeptide phosphotransferase/UDP-N-acetylglucosamine-1-phosphate transferase